MGAWRGQLPSTFATASGQAGAAYQGMWTGIVAFWAGRSGGTLVERMRGGSVAALTVTGATAQDDGLRFDGVDDYARIDRDADLESPSTAVTLMLCFRLLADPADEAWYCGRYDANMGNGCTYGFQSRQWNTNRDLDFTLRVTDGGGTTVPTDHSLAVPNTGVDYIAVGRWAQGEAHTIRIYLASDGSLLDTANGPGALTGTITYASTAAASGWELGRIAGGSPLYVNMDVGVNAAWSRKLTDTEVADLVTDPYGPIRLAASSPLRLILAQME